MYVCSNSCTTATKINDFEQEDDKPFTIKLNPASFEGYELDVPSLEFQTTKAEMKQMYYDMTSIRYKLFALKFLGLN